MLTIECKQITFQGVEAYAFYLTRMDKVIRWLKRTERNQRNSASAVWQQSLKGTVCHKMITPLKTFNHLVLCVMKKMNLTPEQHTLYEMLATMYVETEFLTGYVNDLLDLRALEIGTFERLDHIFDPNKAIDKVITMFDSQLKKNKISIDVSVSNRINESRYGCSGRRDYNSIANS